MALEQAQGIINSYIQGIQTALARKQQASEQQWRQAESDRANAQVQQQKDQFAEELKQHKLENDRLAAQQKFDLASHAAQLAQNLQPKIDPTTNAPMVDSNGIGTYDSPLGGTFQSPTREQQQNIALLNLKNQKQAEAEIAWQSKQKELDAEHTNRLSEIGEQGKNQLALGNLDRASAEKIAREAQAGENFRHNSTIANDRLISSINAGLVDPSVLGGNTQNQTGGYIPNAILLKEAALKGDLSAEQLDKMGVGLKNYVRNLVTQVGGVVLPQKKIDAINHIANLSEFGKQMQDTNNLLPQGSTAIGRHIGGSVMPMLDPELSKKFDLLGAQGANIAKGIGGEEGQRLTNFTTKLTGGSYIPDKSLTREANQIGIEGYKKELEDTIDNETLGGIPASQAAYIKSSRGIGNHAIKGISSAPVQIQQTPNPTGQPVPIQYPDPNSFLHPSLQGGK